MKGHVLRPLYVVIALVLAILLLRMFTVPDDFGTHETGYMYGWHRKGNEEEWKQFKVKYRGVKYCMDCHPDNYSTLMKSPHAVINCENCHSPAIDHPSEPEKLDVNRNREQCLRCHAILPYKGTGRAMIRGVNDDEHNRGIECVTCHNPHSPGFG